MQFNWEPPKEYNLTGCIVFNGLSVEERLTIGSKIIVSAAEAAGGDEAKAQVDAGTHSLLSSIALAKSKIKSVDLKHNETGKEYKSYADINGDEDLHPMIIDMAGAYAKRIDLGKLLKMKLDAKLPQSIEDTDT